MKLPSPVEMAANRMLRSYFQREKKYKLGRLQIQWVGNIGLRPSLIFFGTDMALTVFLDHCDSFALCQEFLRLVQSQMDVMLW